jgi:hypothetical protein
VRGPVRPKHRQAALGELEHTAPVERDRRTVRCAEPAFGPALGRSGLVAAARAQERACRHLGCLLAFALGGRRGGEVARLRVEQLRDEPPARLDPRDPRWPPLPCHAIQLGGPRPATATRRAGASGQPSGRGAARMAERADIKKAPIFRAIVQWEAAEDKALTPQSISRIVKRVAIWRRGGRRRFSRPDCVTDI